MIPEMQRAPRKFDPDATFARAAQAGDATGLGVLFERHRARLHAVAVNMLGHGPDADDAVQDTMLIAVRRIGELREPAAAGGWLVAILVNVCRAHLRRPARELASDSIESSGVLDDTVERGALSEWVWSALERLPEPQRVAIMLRHFSSSAHSYAAIADLCDVPVGTVRSP
jgi:RNA polymerase sigma-70 factor (ECF subfamily)